MNKQCLIKSKILWDYDQNHLFKTVYMHTGDGVRESKSESESERELTTLLLSFARILKMLHCISEVSWKYFRFFQLCFKWKKKINYIEQSYRNALLCYIFGEWIWLLNLGIILFSFSSNFPHFSQRNFFLRIYSKRLTHKVAFEIIIIPRKCNSIENK